MRKSAFAAATLAALATFGLALPSAAANPKPPANFQGQWWTHPKGCEYSRAGRPGEVMWFLIVNTARPGCPTYIAGKTWGNIYKDEGPRIRR